MSRIHPTAIIDPQARLDASVQVGPYSMIESGVQAGSGTCIGPYVHILKGTQIGSDCVIHTGAVIGDKPQVKNMTGPGGFVQIGRANTIRENVTIHRSMRRNRATWIGDENFIMSNAHIGHDCRLESHIVLCQGAILGGHVAVDEGAYIGGHVGIHQFCRIGALSICSGSTLVTLDVPPYFMAYGDSEVVGINTVGLRRAGFSSERRLSIRRIFKLFYQLGFSRRRIIDRLEREISEKVSAEYRGDINLFIDFLKSTKRGICTYKNQRIGPSSEQVREMARISSER